MAQSSSAPAAGTVGPKPSRLGLWLPAAALGLAMAMPTIVFTFEVSPYLQAGSVVAFALPLAMLAPQARLSAETLRAFLLLVALIVGPLVASMLLHAESYGFVRFGTGLARIVALAIYMTTIAVLVAHPHGAAILKRAFVALACVMLAVFAYYALVEPVWSWGRFEPGDFQPNWWGELMVAIVFGGAFVDRRLIRYAFWGCALVGLVLVQSRGSLGAALTVIAFATLHHEGWRRLLTIGSVGAVFVLPVVVLLDVLVLGNAIFAPAVRWVSESVLLLDDPNRGLESGLAGRVESWAVAFEVIAAHPVLGVGFSRSDLISMEAIGTAIHNGHLSLLADLGALLYAVLLAMMAIAIVVALRRGELVAFGMLVAFSLFYMIFGPRGVNMSVLSMVFWMMVTLVLLAPGTRAFTTGEAPGAGPGRAAAPAKPPIGRRWARPDTLARG